MKRRLLFLTAALLALSCEGRPRVNPPDPSDPATQPRVGAALAILDLAGGAPEQQASGLLNLAPRKETFDELVRAIQKIGRDKNVNGVFVRFGGASMGFARAQEIGELLEGVRKSGKAVNCHGEAFSNATLYAAARGCSHIAVSEAGEVEAIGLAAQVVYMRKLLVDKVGLSVDILQVGKYKGAEEPLTRDGPSPEARATLEAALSDIRASWMEGIKQGRPKLDAAAAEDGPYSPRKAVERGLIDEVAYADEVRERTRKQVSAVRDDVRFGGTSEDSQAEDLGDLVRVLAGSSGGSGPVALLRATGSIAMAPSGGLFGGRGGITEREMTRVLQKVERDDDIKALVLRIDSPGGSALASDLIWHQLMRVRAKKPIVVSVGEMAASGGYYIASTGNEIFAEPTSIVGSIGVVGGKISIGGALEKFGVHAETFPAKKDDPTAAARAAYLSLLTQWDDPTRVRVLETMTSIYQLFLKRIVEGRAGKLTLTELEPSTEGRIFGGREAKERKLLDAIGGLSAAIARAKELAGLAPDARVAVVGGHQGLLENFGGGDGADGDEGSSGRSPVRARLSEEVRSIVGDHGQLADLLPFVESLGPMMAGERAITALPYGLLVR